METKTVNHTPGPWDTGTLYTTVIAPRPEGWRVDLRVADCHVNNLSEDERVANARLIAAAPELLEALRVMLIQFPYKDGEGAAKYHAWNMGHEAIAKATQS